MSEIIKNGTPQNVKYGTDDQSVPEKVLTQAGVPIHLPLMFTFSPKGDPNNAYVVSGDNLKAMYGDEVVGLKNKYTTFNTPYLELFNRNANEIMVQRLVPDDAATASLRLYAEVLETKVPDYERNADGSVLYENGAPKVKGQIDGLLIAWHFGAFSDSAGQFKQGNIFDGTLTNAGGVKSKIYPILDMPAPYPGAKPNDFGLRLSCGNEKSKTPVPADYAMEVGGRLLSLQFVDQTVPGMSPSITRTIKGQTSVLFSFKPEAYYRPMRTELDFEDVALAAYRNMNPDPGYIPQLGPVQDMYVYRNNLETVLEKAKAFIKDDDTLTNPYMVDIFSGLDLYGNPYNGLHVDDGDQGGEILTDSHTHYLIGGSDGTMTNETFDQLVRKEMINFGTGTVNYLNLLKYPSSFLWDSGFSTDTKEALTNYIGRMKNTNLVLVTHVFDQGTNTMQTEEAMKIALSAMLRALPESTKYGTNCMRGHLLGHSMFLSNSQYKERVPVSYSLASKFSKYAGSSQGKFLARNKFSRGELTVITEGFDFNLDYKPFPVYVSDWEAGLISLRSFDQWRYHFPALYTVYDEDRSILNNWLIAPIIGNLEYLSEQVWAEMSGVSDMTDSQVAKMVRDKLILKTEGRYDGVVDLGFEPYFSDEDKSNGNSISIKIHVYGAVMKTVFKTTIVAHRFQEG